MTGRAMGVARVDLVASFPSVTSDSAVWRADLDGRRCRTGPQFLIEVGVVLGFPAYYGRNWDAFNECFGDLLDVTTGGMGHEFYDRPGRPERVLNLVVDHADDLLSEETDPRFLEVVVSRFQDPFPHYSPPQLWHRYADLHVTLVCAPDSLSSCTARLRTAGLRSDGPPP